MSTLAKADQLLHQAMADQRAVMAEMVRRRTAKPKHLKHVLPDKMRVKCALRGLRARGYLHCEYDNVSCKSVYHIADDYPEDDLDLLMAVR